MRGWHSKPFLFDSREALAYIASIAGTYPPPTVADRARVTILTDGLCGSTCCQFATMAREAHAATFVGVGGLWGEPIDVASYCGGYVNTPGALAADAAYYNATTTLSAPVPQFETSAYWQWNQGVMYSRARPSLPAQFVPAPADVRVPHWAFPHVSVPVSTSDARRSELWNVVVADALARYQPASASSSSSPTGDAVASGYRTATIALGAAAGVVAIVAAFAWECGVRRKMHGSESGSSHHKASDAVPIAANGHTENSNESGALAYVAIDP